MLKSFLSFPVTALLFCLALPAWGAPSLSADREPDPCFEACAAVEAGFVDASVTEGLCHCDRAFGITLVEAQRDSGQTWCAQQPGIAIDARSSEKRPSGSDWAAIATPLWMRTVAHNGEYSKIRDLYYRHHGAVKILAVVNQESLGAALPANNANYWTWSRYADAYAAAAVDLARNYGQFIAAYELWNEPDHMGIPTYRAALLIQRAALALNREGIDEPFITGGIVASPSGWTDYLSQMIYYIGSQAWPLIDGVGLHPYNHSVDGHPGDAAWGDMEATILEAHRRGFYKPVWLTEFGLAEAVGSPDWGRQAVFLDKAYDLFYDLGPNVVPHAFWFAFDDRVYQQPNLEHWGLVNYNHANLRLAGEFFRNHTKEVQGNLACSTWDGDVDGCDAHGWGTTQDCAYYFCSGKCRPRGTSNCQAGCSQYCNGTSADLPCSTWDGDLQGCDAHGWGTTQDCAYYFCSGKCRPRGTSNCQAGCSNYCCN